MNEFTIKKIIRGVFYPFYLLLNFLATLPWWLIFKDRSWKECWNA